jgi:hypothetical protein
MPPKYTHLQLDQDCTCFAGYYTPQKEVRLKYNNREVLYVLGQAVIESSCCASGCWQYAIVPGYIINWQSEKNEAGLPISEVEPISDEATRGNISRIIKDAEVLSQVDFW